MAADPPSPAPPERESELFQLFRGLRERVFRGSSDLVSRVMRGVEEQLKATPEESLATSMLVQLTNLFTSWVEPEDAAPRGPDDDEPDPREPDE